MSCLSSPLSACLMKIGTIRQQSYFETHVGLGQRVVFVASEICAMACTGSPQLAAAAACASSQQARKGELIFVDFKIGLAGEDRFPKQDLPTLRKCDISRFVWLAAPMHGLYVCMSLSQAAQLRQHPKKWQGPTAAKAESSAWHIASQRELCAAPVATTEPPNKARIASVGG